LRGVRGLALVGLALGGAEIALAVAGNVPWTDAFDATLEADQANVVAVKGRRVVVAGRSDDLAGGGAEQALVRALDAKTGAELWTHRLEHVTSSEAQAIAISGSRAFVALEAENADAFASGDDWMVAAHSLKDGATLWESILPSTGDEQVVAIAAKGSRVFAGGEAENLVSTGEDPLVPASGRDWLVRALSAKKGSVLWEDRVDSAALTDRVVSLAVSGRRVVAAGVSNDAAAEGSDGDWLVRALDAKKGNLLWESIVDGGGADTPRHVAISGRTTVVVGRSTDAVGVATGDDWLVHAYDTKTGDLLWDDAVDFEMGDDQPRHVAAGKKQVIVAGWATNAVDASSDEDLVVRAYDTKTGDLLWDDLFDGAAGIERAEQVVHAGKVVLVGGRSQRLVAVDSGSDWVVRAYDPGTGNLLWDDVYDAALANDRVSSTRGGLAVSGKRAFAVGRAANLVDPESSRDWLVRAYDLK
jgi:hypothetical protein